MAKPLPDNDYPAPGHFSAQEFGDRMIVREYWRLVESGKYPDWFDQEGQTTFDPETGESREEWLKRELEQLRGEVLGGKAPRA